jgi:hypothetical protein
VKLKKKQEDQRKHMMEFVDRFRYKASKARQAQSRLKALSKLEPIAELIEDRVAPFFFPNPEKAIAPPLVKWDKVSVGYAENKPCSGTSRSGSIPMTASRLLGSNGNGKSTFAKLLCGKLQPMAGEMKYPAAAHRGLFRPAPAGRNLARAYALFLFQRADAGCAGGEAARKARRLWLSERPGGFALRHAVGRREGAPSLRARGLPRAAHSGAGRADEPSRRRQPRGADHGDQRL